jgi:hypothetical protein
MAIGVDQALGEGLPIMRVSVDDSIGVRRKGGRGGNEAESQCQSAVLKAS